MARLRNGGYDVATIIQGFPGKSENHGFLGWSTVGLLRGCSGARFWLTLAPWECAGS